MSLYSLSAFKSTLRQALGSGHIPIDWCSEKKPDIRHPQNPEGKNSYRFDPFKFPHIRGEVTSWSLGGKRK